MTDMLQKKIIEYLKSVFWELKFMRGKKINNSWDEHPKTEIEMMEHVNYEIKSFGGLFWERYHHHQRNI